MFYIISSIFTITIVINMQKSDANGIEPKEMQEYKTIFENDIYKNYKDNCAKKIKNILSYEDLMNFILTPSNKNVPKMFSSTTLCKNTVSNFADFVKDF